MDGSASPADIESISEIETGVMADLPESVSITAEVIQCDVPTPLPHEGECVSSARTESRVAASELELAIPVDQKGAVVGHRQFRHPALACNGIAAGVRSRIKC